MIVEKNGPIAGPKMESCLRQCKVCPEAIRTSRIIVHSYSVLSSLCYGHGTVPFIYVLEIAHSLDTLKVTIDLVCSIALWNMVCQSNLVSKVQVDPLPI